jgi:hypothetical protein
MQKLNVLFLAAIVMLTIGWAAPAAADTILFDGDGTGGNVGFQQIDLLDWSPGNAIAVGATAGDPVNTTFQLYYQANLVAALDSNSQIVYANNSAGAGNDAFTLVLGFQETIASSTFNPVTNTGDLTFAFAAGGNNFFQIYANTTPGNNLSGACFVCGSLVMSGSILPNNFVSNFSGLVGNAGNLDQAGSNAPPTDDYAGVDTIGGTGSVTLTGGINFFDTNYFMGLGGSTITFAFANANTNLPFLQIEPSACFFATTSTGGLNPTCSGTGGSTGVAPFVGVGSVGALNAVSGPNTMFQADGNASFATQQVPEPAGLVLLGIGLLGTAAVRRQRKAKK